MSKATKYNFKELTAQQIHDFMEQNATTEQKKAFKKVAFPTRKKKKGVPQFTASGEPIMYQKKNKQGQPLFDDNGNPVMAQKLKMVEVKGGEEKATFSLLDAKWWFAENFPNAVENVPDRHPEKKEKTSDIFKDW
jgi:hypothetical protein